MKEDGCLAIQYNQHRAPHRGAYYPPSTRMSVSWDARGARHDSVPRYGGPGASRFSRAGSCMQIWSHRSCRARQHCAVQLLLHAAGLCDTTVASRCVTAGSIAMVMMLFHLQVQLPKSSALSTHAGLQTDCRTKGVEAVSVNPTQESSSSCSWRRFTMQSRLLSGKFLQAGSRGTIEHAECSPTG